LTCQYMPLDTWSGRGRDQRSLCPPGNVVVACHLTSEGHGTTTFTVAKSDSPAYSLATSILWRCTLPSLLLSWLRRAHPPLYADRTSSHGAVASPARSTASAPRWPRSSAGRKPSIQTDHRNQTGSPFANGWLITLCRRIKQRQLGRDRLAAARPLTFVQEDLQLPSQGIDS